MEATVEPGESDLLQVFTVAEVAKRLRTTDNQVYALIQRKHLRSVKPFPKAKEHRILATDFKAYLDSL